MDIAQAQGARPGQAGKVAREIGLRIPADNPLANPETVGIADRFIAVIGGKEGGQAADRTTDCCILRVGGGSRFQEAEIVFRVERQPLAGEVALTIEE